MRVYQRCVCKKGSLVHYTFYQSGILENILTWSGTDECSQDQQSFWGGNTLPFLKDLYNEPSADICWEWSCSFSFQSGPKTLDSIQPVNFTKWFLAENRGYLPTYSPFITHQSLQFLNSWSTVWTFFFPRRCCCFFFGLRKNNPQRWPFFSAKSKVPRSEHFQWSGSLPFLQVLQNNFFWRWTKLWQIFQVEV